MNRVKIISRSTRRSLLTASECRKESTCFPHIWKQVYLDYKELLYECGIRKIVQTHFARRTEQFHLN